MISIFTGIDRPSSAVASVCCASRNIDNSSVMIFCVSHALCTLQMPKVSVAELDDDKYFRTRENFTGEGN